LRALEVNHDHAQLDSVPALVISDIYSLRDVFVAAQHWLATHCDTLHAWSMGDRYGIHTTPLSDVNCIKIIQDEHADPAPAVNVYYWDDDDAVWHQVCVRLCS
jgi:hypothetical protein